MKIPMHNSFIINFELQVNSCSELFTRLEDYWNIDIELYVNI